jgi:hypothetical protein
MPGTPPRSRAIQEPHQSVRNTHPRHDLCHLKNKNSAAALVFKVDARLMYTRPQLESIACGSFVRKTCKSLAG